MSVAIWDTGSSPPVSSRGRPDPGGLLSSSRPALPGGRPASKVAGFGERLLGQDELVRLGDVQPVFLAAVHDDDLPPSPEQLRARDADALTWGGLSRGRGPSRGDDHAPRSLFSR